ncbi:MAG: hypothetical protein QGH60_24175 [Phycisphaerae bacterium]|nr:hypothetical protein [Phycisphaerae bacterium]
MAKKRSNDEISESLLEELQEFKAEKEKIRSVVGQIGGKASKKTEAAINVIFVLAVLGLFVFDIVRHIYHVAEKVPPMLSLSLGVFLVSIKIVWMIHRQSKIDHFQFWILNSIEYRINDVSTRVRGITKAMEAWSKAQTDGDDSAGGEPG